MRARPVSPRCRSLTTNKVGTARRSLPRPAPRALSRRRPVTLRGEKLRLLACDERRERAPFAHHAPPGHVVELVQRTDYGSRAAGTARAERDLAVRQDMPAANISDDAAHRARECAEARGRVSRPHLSAGSKL